MPGKLTLVALMLGLAGLGGCHTDPFSIKPEVNVTRPERAPDAAAPDEGTGEKEAPGASEEASA